MNKFFLNFIFILLIIFGWVNAIYALSVQTHKAINEQIAQSTLNGFSLDAYLKNQLGFKSGVKEKFNSLMMWELLRDGGEYEDKYPGSVIPYIRSANHFHDPLKPLAQAGFSGIWDIPHFFTGDSAVSWSQKSKNTQSPGGYYSWHDVRNYFYNALTTADKDTRNTNFAETFRGLGQLMHLIQDMSVPEFTRNDRQYEEERGQRI